MSTTSRRALLRSCVDITTLMPRAPTITRCAEMTSFLVALPTVRGLLLCAKHLFVEAMHG